MSYEVTGAGAPDELRCRYGMSKLTFRGPRRNLDDPYVAFLGGSETYGQHIETPFVRLVEMELGRRCVNLGVVNAGLDALVTDPDVMRIAGKAEQIVVQVLGAQNLTNRFYRVHPRRNDRFLAASPLLEAIYRDVDFTEFNFVKHMLGTLQMVSPERFSTVRDELQQAWLARMRLFLQTMDKKVVLLWVQYRDEDSALGAEPLGITDGMIDQLRALVHDVVEVPVLPARLNGEVSEMMFGQMQAPSAGHLIGPSAHRQIADRLKATISHE